MPQHRVEVVLDESGWAPIGTTLSGVISGEVINMQDAGNAIWIVSLDVPIMVDDTVVRRIGIQQRHKGKPVDLRYASSAVNLHLFMEGASKPRFVAVAIASPQRRK